MMTRLVRIQPTTVREAPPSGDVRHFVVTSRDGKYDESVYFAPASSAAVPDLAVIQRHAAGAMVQCIARAILGGWVP